MGYTATIDGGEGNNASGGNATISGGTINKATAGSATVGGGYSNNASYFAATIGGGIDNAASGNSATIGGGAHNIASSNYATVSGGWGNKAITGTNSTVSGGNQNSASGGYATVGGGDRNNADGDFATVSGGSNNSASGNLSFAAGLRAKANNQGAFVWADSTNADFASTGNDQFLIRANGGVGIGTNGPAAQLNLSSNGGFTNPQLRLDQTNSGDCVRLRMNVSGSTYPYDIASCGSNGTLAFWRSDGGNVLVLDPVGTHRIDTNTGAYLSSGGTWTNSSDRNLKQNFATINGRNILARLNSIPIQTWNYTVQDPSIRHIGPMAQGFYAAFNVGEDDKHITTIDADGVALAAIQGLYQIVQEKDAEIAGLKSQVASQRAEMDGMKTRVGALEKSNRDPKGLTNWNAAIALVIGALGVVAFERARKGGVG